jgi:hypothetical protein
MPKLGQHIRFCKSCDGAQIALVITALSFVGWR